MEKADLRLWFATLYIRKVSYYGEKLVLEKNKNNWKQQSNSQKQISVEGLLEFCFWINFVVIVAVSP